MNNVRLVCGNVSLDLPSDFGILINKSIADIREPESRSSDWSKSFTLPGTKTNNRLFTHLFDLNLSIRNTSATNFSPDFNPNLKADAILQVDEVTQIEGFIRLLSIKVNDLNQIEYECSMHGQLADLFAKISDAKLADLSLTEYNHTISSTNIFNSWNTSIIKNGSTYVNFSGGVPIGDGYVYGWLDNGQYADYRNLYTDDITPYVYAKTVVDKIFSGAGYTYTSDSFFNSAQFRRLVIPCPTQMPILSESQIQQRQFEAKSSGSTNYTKGSQILFPTEISDPSSQYNPSTSKFTNGYSGQRYDFFFVCKAEFPYTTNYAYQFWYGLYINGVRKKWVMIDTYNINLASNKVEIDVTVAFSNIQLNTGDLVEIRREEIFSQDTTLGVTNWTATSATYTQLPDSKFLNGIIDGIYGIGDTMDLAGFFTGVETKQREFMRWIFTMFNLYTEADPDITKRLVVMAREDFNQTTVKDWTAKRDLSQQLEIIPMGELDAGKYTFTYKEGDDDGNKFYKEDFARTYGDRQIVINNDFVKDDKKIEIGFVPTLIVKPENEADKYLPDLSTNDGKQKSGDLRILQYKYLTCKNYNVIEGSKQTATASSVTAIKTNYPYMGHLNEPTASTSDINFGMPRFIGVAAGTSITNNNLFNAYWSKYISEITDKDSKIVRGNFYLTPADMEKLSFRDLYFFDGNYFRLNKIEDYDPINPSVNICEFLFLKSGPTFTASTGVIGGGGSQSSGTNEEYDPRGGNVSSKVIQQRGIDIGNLNSAGQGIMVGNGNVNFGQRNAAFATSGVAFLCDDSIVIGVAPPQPVNCNEVWMQGQLVEPNNFGTNRFVYPTANYTAELQYDIIIFSANGNHTITLPPAATSTSKAFWVVKKGAGGTLRIEASSGDLIDARDHYNINNQYGTAYLVSDGIQWYALTNK
jgi:hypothetical protein